MNLTNSTVNVFKHTDESILLKGIEFFIRFFPEYFPYAFLSALGVVIGILGNLLIAGAIFVTKELHTTSNLIVFNLALADLSISVVVDSLTVVGIFYGPGYFDTKPFLCIFVGFFCLMTCEASLMTIGLIALNRYIKICYTGLYDRWFSKRKTIIYCIICWVIGVLINVPNFSGWGGFYFDLKTRNCIWNRLASRSYSIFFPMSSIVMPCAVILYFYIRIFVFAVRAKARTGNSQFKSSLRIAKGLFSSYLLFTICWLPYGVVVMLDHNDMFPPTAHVYTMMFAHLNSSLNPLLYAVSNPLYQKGYMNFIRFLFCLPQRAANMENKSTKKTPLQEQMTKF